MLAGVKTTKYLHEKASPYLELKFVAWYGGHTMHNSSRDLPGIYVKAPVSCKDSSLFRLYSFQWASPPLPFPHWPHSTLSFVHPSMSLGERVPYSMLGLVSQGWNKASVHWPPPPFAFSRLASATSSGGMKCFVLVIGRTEGEVWNLLTGVKGMQTHINIIQLNMYVGWAGNKPDSIQNYTLFTLIIEHYTGWFKLKNSGEVVFYYYYYYYRIVDSCWMNVV